MGAYIRKGGAVTAPGFRMDPFDINKEVSISKYTGNHLRRIITADALIMCLTAVSPASAAVLEAEGKYYSRFGSYAELLEHVGEVNTQTAEEGQVLLKNDGTLPLTGTEKVSVFGIASSTTVAGPTSNSAYKQHPTSPSASAARSMTA